MSYPVKAIHEIQRAAKAGVRATKTQDGVPPEVETLRPGTKFVIDDKKQYLELKAAGAIEDDTPQEDLDDEDAEAVLAVHGAGRTKATAPKKTTTSKPTKAAPVTKPASAPDGQDLV